MYAMGFQVLIPRTPKYDDSLVRKPFFYNIKAAIHFNTFFEELLILCDTIETMLCFHSYISGFHIIRVSKAKQIIKYHL